MHHTKFTEKLVRILKTLEAGEVPVRVKELYVFGSYSRGAIEPGDLDLILVYDSTDCRWAEEQVRLMEEQGQSLLAGIGTLTDKFQAAVRKQGEPIQVLVTQDVNDVTGEGSRIKPDDVVLLWSDRDPDWEAKLATIKPDESATRAPRNHLVPLTRLDDNVGTMEAVVEMIELQRLAFMRLPVESIDLKMSASNQHWLDHWTMCKVMGAKSMETLPYAMWWLQQDRQVCEVPDRTEIYSKSRTHRLEVGKPSLRWMLWRFIQKPKLKRQCLIPHFKVKGPNELLVFERGATWLDFTEGDSSYDKVFHPLALA